MRIVFPLLLLAGLCAGGAIAAEPALRFDPFNPVALNEFAMQKIRDRDFSGAAILLECAALLAPHDARNAHNLQVLRAWREGKPVTETTASVSASAGKGLAENRLVILAAVAGCDGAMNVAPQCEHCKRRSVRHRARYGQRKWTRYLLSGPNNDAAGTEDAGPPPVSIRPLR